MLHLLKSRPLGREAREYPARGGRHAASLDFHLAQPPLVPGARKLKMDCGTPPYIAPEQLAAMLPLDGLPAPLVDGRADIFALAMVLHVAARQQATAWRRQDPGLAAAGEPPGSAPGWLRFSACAGERAAPAISLRRRVRGRLATAPRRPTVGGRRESLLG